MCRRVEKTEKHFFFFFRLAVLSIHIYIYIFSFLRNSARKKKEKKKEEILGVILSHPPLSLFPFSDREKKKKKTVKETHSYTSLTTVMLHA